MAKYYTLSDIFKHEDTTRYYCNSEGGFELTPYELIDLAAEEHEFDTDYAEYVIFKHLHQIAAYTARKSTKIGHQINITHNQNLLQDLENNNLRKEYYEGWFLHYVDDPDDESLGSIFSIIDQAVRDNNWEFLYYLYYREEDKLYNLLNNYKNKIRDRNFFIIQM